MGGVAEMSGAVDRAQTEEYKKLKSELKNVTKAAAVETGEKAKQRQVGATDWQEGRGKSSALVR